LLTIRAPDVDKAKPAQSRDRAGRSAIFSHFSTSVKWRNHRGFTPARDFPRWSCRASCRS
jgi:hypothetical protein